MALLGWTDPVNAPAPEPAPEIAGLVHGLGAQANWALLSVWNPARQDAVHGSAAVTITTAIDERPARSVASTLAAYEPGSAYV